MNLSRIRTSWLLAIFALAGTLHLRGEDSLIDEVCYESDFPRECSQHVLQCQEGILSIDKALRGFKRNWVCPGKKRNCTDTGTCCRHNSSDCLLSYEQQAFSNLEMLCHNQTNCTFVPVYHERRQQECNNSFESISIYSQVYYHCIKDEVSTASFTTPFTGLTSAGTEGSHANGVGIIGGAVGAVLLIILVIVGVFCFKWRRSLAKPSTMATAKYQARDGGIPGTGLASPDLASQSSVYENPADAATLASRGPRNDSSDYDLLGQKTPDTSPRDVTYGHLNLSADVTEGDYDHVGRGLQAQGSRDVIDNIYSKAGPPGATSSFDDNVHYDVSGAVTKHRRDVIDSPYDVTSV